MVPTLDSVRYEALLRAVHGAGRAGLLVGGAGMSGGATQLCMQMGWMTCVDVQWGVVCCGMRGADKHALVGVYVLMCTLENMQTHNTTILFSLTIDPRSPPTPSTLHKVLPRHARSTNS